mmetsp:Transcript_20863/g.43690  ORF Transcript_20863/g.43690 Transcript_20863/m.43690 type:complete len:196 (+) Transcript_20863:1239-1826(+)
MTNARIAVPMLSTRKAVVVVTGCEKYSPKALADCKPDAVPRTIPFFDSNAAMELPYSTKLTQLPKIAPTYWEILYGITFFQLNDFDGLIIAKAIEIAGLRWAPEILAVQQIAIVTAIIQTAAIWKSPTRESVNIALKTDPVPTKTIKNVPISSAIISRKRALETSAAGDASPPLKLRRSGRNSMLFLLVADSASL